MHFFAWFAAVAVAVLVLDRALRALEDRGLVYYRRIKPGAAAGSALATLASFVEPQADQIVIEAREREEREDDDDDGDKRRSAHGSRAMTGAP